ncbi:MAG: GTPase [archaeon]|jgi:hypothetical protein
MATNVSIEFSVAQQKYDTATTDEERLVALNEMKSTAPHHKGCESLRAEINSKLAKLKSSMERQSSQSKKGSAPSMYVKKEGMGQVVIMGLPNTGKSWLLNKLVGKEIAHVTNYGFSTYKPEPGMMSYEGGVIQLVELPALIEGASEGKSNGRELISLARNADAIIIVGTPDDQKIIADELTKSKIFLNKTRPLINVKASDFRGIQMSGKEYLKFPQDQLINYLKSCGFANSTVLITGEIKSLDDVSEAMNNSIVYRKTLFINTYEVTDASLVDLKDKIFLLLDKMLIYTKKPGDNADKSDPMALPVDSTLQDVAETLHKDLAKKLKFAKVWGSTKFPGQRVGPEYILKDKDVVEISI